MPNASRFRLHEIAERFGLSLHGDGQRFIAGVTTLQATDSPAETLAFLANPQYRKFLATTAASAVVVRAEDAADCPVPALISPNPYAAYARIAALFEPSVSAPAGIHPTAVIADTAKVDPTASIGPLAVIGERSVVAAGAVIGAGCVIGEDCSVGAGSRLVARVTLVCRVHLGERVLVHPGAVIGADGFGLAPDQGAWLKVPQLGGVQIGNDCEIGANTTIDRGAIDDTVLEEDVRLDNQIQVGHNVRIGAHTAIAGCVAIAGSTTIGRWCLIGGAAGIVGHLTLCDKVTIGAMSLVTHSIDTPGEYASGTPLQPKREWRKNAARFGQLDRLARLLLRKSD